MRIFSRKYLQIFIVPNFAPKEGVKIAVNYFEVQEAEPVAGDKMELDDECDQIIAALPKPASLAGFRLDPIEFDKDIDGHMLFVTAYSNFELSTAVFQLRTHINPVPLQERLSCTVEEVHGLAN